MTAPFVRAISARIPPGRIKKQLRNSPAGHGSGYLTKTRCGFGNKLPSPMRGKRTEATNRPAQAPEANQTNPLSSLRPLLHGHAFRFAFGLTASHKLNVPRPMSSASPISRPQKSAGGASGVQVEGARRAAMRRKAASRAHPIRSKTRRACFITFLLGLPRPAARS